MKNFGHFAISASDLKGNCWQRVWLREVTETHFVILTNTIYCNLDKYMIFFGQIHEEFWTNRFCGFCSWFEGQLLTESLVERGDRNSFGCGQSCFPRRQIAVYASPILCSTGNGRIFKFTPSVFVHLFNLIFPISQKGLLIPIDGFFWKDTLIDLWRQDNEPLIVLKHLWCRLFFYLFWSNLFLFRLFDLQNCL